MTVLLGLLRGVNVGGHKRVPMAELRELCAELGFERARTYIQSGNVVFVEPSSARRGRDTASRRPSSGASASPWTWSCARQSSGTGT